MTVATLALRRRTAAERKALAMLRGESFAVVAAGVPDRRRRRPASSPTASHLRQFADLRLLAQRHGLTILPPASPYVGPDELRLLAWLAGAQRTIRPTSVFDDPTLATAIVRCAGLLGGMGLRLSPPTLYWARLRATDIRGTR